MANAAGVLFGHDVSHHQEDIDVGRLDCEFIIARTLQVGGAYATGHYGTTYDRAYATHKANARRGSKLFGSYVYLGTDETPERNAALHASVEPDRNVPVMVDWERGSGTCSFLHDCVGELEDLGYRVNLTYAPQWYLAEAGGGSLAGLPPLVPSKYANNQAGAIATKYAQTSESIWNGYGGNTVAVVQFSSTGTDATYPGVPLDCLAFKGSRDALAALFSGGGAPPATEDEGDEDVSSDVIIGTGTGADQPWQDLVVPVNGHQYLRIASTYQQDVIVEGISMVDDTPGAKGTHGVTVQTGGEVDADRPGPWNLAGADKAFANYSHIVARVKAPAGAKVKAWINDRA